MDSLPCSAAHCPFIWAHILNQGFEAMCRMISCQTLGPVGLSVDGAPAPSELLWRKHLGLLVYLSRSPRGRARERLIGLLWGEKAEAAPVIR